MQHNVASDRRLTARLVFHAASRANEPLGESVELRLDRDGFHWPREAGSSGEDLAPASLDAIAATLSQTFDPVELAAMLSHVATLQRRLSP